MWTAPNKRRTNCDFPVLVQPFAYLNIYKVVRGPAWVAVFNCTLNSRLWVTVFNCTLLAGCEWQFLIAPSWQAWCVHVVCRSANKISPENRFLCPALKLMNEYIKWQGQGHQHVWVGGKVFGCSLFYTALICHAINWWQYPHVSFYVRDISHQKYLSLISTAVGSGPLRAEHRRREARREIFCNFPTGHKGIV